MAIGIAIVANKEEKRRAEPPHKRQKKAQRYCTRMEARDNKQKIKSVMEDLMKVQREWKKTPEWRV